MADPSECACGRPIEVAVSEAWTSRVCDCGVAATVPSPSRLRERANLDAYESRVIDTLHRMLREGTLPWGESRAASGEPTCDVLDVFVKCERIHPATDRMRAMLFGRIGMFLVRHEARDAFGRHIGLLAEDGRWLIARVDRLIQGTIGNRTRHS
jgi:hypothetical protein